MSLLSWNRIGALGFLATGCLTSCAPAPQVRNEATVMRLQSRPLSGLETTAPFSSMRALAGGSVYGQAIGVTSIVYGEKEPTKETAEETILFSGLLEITKSAVVKTPDGRRQLNLKFDSRTPNGAITARAADTSRGQVLVWVDPEERSIGTLREVLGHSHESGHGQAELYLVFAAGATYTGPDFGLLRNREPVVLTSHIHSVPPITRPIKLVRNMSANDLRKMMEDVGNADKWVGANNYPIPLYSDKDGKIHAWFTPYVHVTTLTGLCGDGVDNDVDGKIDEELPDNKDNDGDGFADEDSVCPK